MSDLHLAEIGEGMSLGEKEDHRSRVQLTGKRTDCAVRGQDLNVTAKYFSLKLRTQEGLMSQVKSMVICRIMMVQINLAI